MHTISIAEWWLVLASFTMTAIAATGVYEALFVMPKWFENVPSSLEQMRQRATIKFWIPLQIVSIISIVAGSITNWRVEGIHTALLVSIISFACVWLSTIVFFIPGVIRFSKVDLTKPASPSLAVDGRRWLRLSWLRQVAMIVSAVSLVITLVLL